MHLQRGSKQVFGDICMMFALHCKDKIQGWTRCSFLRKQLMLVLAVWGVIFFSFLRLNALAITLFLNLNSTHFSPAVMMVVVSQFNVPSQLLESFWRLQVRMYFQESTRMLHEKKKKKHTSVKAFFQCISLLSWIISNTEMSNRDEKPKNTKNGAERFSKGRLEMSGVHLRTLRTCSYDPKLFWQSVVWQMPFCRTVHKMLGKCFLGSISK